MSPMNAQTSSFDPARTASLAGSVVYFGHQSVGSDILTGVHEILGEDPGSSVEVVEISAAGPTRASAPRETGMILHSFVGTNGDPVSKLSDFEEIVVALPERVDVALMKFCYVDIYADLDPADMFEAYRRMIRRLEERLPETIILHVTMPLTTTQPRWKARLKNLAKRALGRDNLLPVDWNPERQKYNALLRGAYGKTGRLFDLALIESTPGDVSNQVHSPSTVVHSLRREYTDDGGHLNCLGRRNVAGEFLSLLCKIIENRSVLEVTDVDI